MEEQAAVSVRLGEKLFEFATFSAWVNGASRIWRFHQVRGADTLCVDQRGRVCAYGKHFMIARDDGSFPIEVFRLRRD